jgi:hypothetical protein
VLEAGPGLLVARWRREISRVEVRDSLAGVERLAPEGPVMLLGDVDGELDAVVDAFASDEALRNRLCILDLARLERVGAVRSSVFVYLEWFLRDEYGVKLLPAAAFTRALIGRGIISLGFG